MLTVEECLGMYLDQGFVEGFAEGFLFTPRIHIDIVDPNRSLKRTLEMKTYFIA